MSQLTGNMDFVSSTILPMSMLHLNNNNTNNNVNNSAPVRSNYNNFVPPFSYYPSPYNNNSNNNSNNNNVNSSSSIPETYTPAKLKKQQEMESRLLSKLAACCSDCDIISPNDNDDEMNKDLKTWKCQECGLINPLFFLKCKGCKNYLENRLRVDVIINIVRKYVPSWSHYYNNQFTVRTLFASNINRLYLVVVNPYGPMINYNNNANSNDDDNNNNNNNNNTSNLLRVVVRIFRGNLPCTRAQLNESYQLFYQAGLGPNVFSTFEIGQIEEHIDGRKIYHDKQRNEIIWKDICSKLLTIHNMKPNEQIYNKNEHNFFNRLNKLLVEMKEYIHINKYQLKQKEFEFTGKDLKTIGEIITIFPKGVKTIQNEILWIQSNIFKLLKKASWEKQIFKLNNKNNDNDDNDEMFENYLVFSHNDMYQGNIMEVNNYNMKLQTNSLNNQQLDNYVLTHYSGQLKIIDYETCNWNYRYYDIANWFIELSINYFRVPNYPYVKIDYEKYPSEQFQKKFISYYLSNLLKEKEENIKKSDIHLFYELVELNGLLSNLYQGMRTFLYGIKAEHEGNVVVRGAKRRFCEPEQIRMDYFEYCTQRFKAYWYSKGKILEQFNRDEFEQQHEEQYKLNNESEHENDHEHEINKKIHEKQQEQEQNQGQEAGARPLQEHYQHGLINDDSITSTTATTTDASFHDKRRHSLDETI